jgi:hypothetical protein
LKTRPAETMRLCRGCSRTFAKAQSADVSPRPLVVVTA